MQLLLLLSCIISTTALTKCLPQRQLLNYFKIKTCFKSSLPIISWKNYKDVKDCMKFARDKNGLAFNFSPPELKNVTHRFKNCQVLGCPEVANSSSFVFDPAFDYYSAYADFSSTANATCIKSLGLFKLIQEKKNYTDAIHQCQNLGGDLADVLSEFRTNSLGSMLKTVMKNWYRAAYVGLSDMEVEGSFESPMGNFLQCSQFRAWGPGHPRPNRTKEDCVILDSDRTWRVINCRIRLASICELQPSAPLKPITEFKFENCSKILKRKEKRQCIANNSLFELYNTSTRIDQCALSNDFN